MNPAAEAKAKVNKTHGEGGLTVAVWDEDGNEGGQVT